MDERRKEAMACRGHAAKTPRALVGPTLSAVSRKLQQSDSATVAERRAMAMVVFAS